MLSLCKIFNIMLNRRILRIKAFKVLYSYAENPSMTLQEARRQLQESIEATRMLYLFLLDVIPALTSLAAGMIRDAQGKFNPTEEERHPNMKFAENRISPLLSEDPDFRKAIDRAKLSWDQNDALVRSLYESIRSKDYFKEYMSDPERSVAQDANLFIRIFEEEFVDNEYVEKTIGDYSIWWSDDLAYALSCCCDTMKEFSQGKRWKLPPLYRSDMAGGRNVESDRDFVFTLLETSYSNFDKCQKLISEQVDKWDDDRIFTTDVVLIVMGLCEAKAFPSMPVKVTINEYVEISKYYSTPKSRSFVNGLLDRLIKKGIDAGEIVKTGEK